jgi:hypothetical protein
MLDDDAGGGFSRAAWFCLGAQEERARQRNAEWARDFMAGYPVCHVDVPAVVAANEGLGLQVAALLDENQALQHRVESAIANNHAWQRWGEKMSARHDRLKQQIADLTEDNQALRQKYDVGERYHTMVETDLRAEITRLRAQVAALSRDDE